MTSHTGSISSVSEVYLVDQCWNTQVDRPPRIGFWVRRSTAVCCICVISLSIAVVSQSRRVWSILVCVNADLR